MTPERWWPCVVATTVVRGADKGDLHGEVRVVDLELGESRPLLAWDEPDFDAETRGGDRGLRGAVVHDGRLWVAASRALLELSPDGEVLGVHRHAWMRSLHQMAVLNGILYVVSTGHDALLGFDPGLRRVVWGMRLLPGEPVFVEVFDPAEEPPAPARSPLHLNQVAAVDGGLQLAALRGTWLLRLQGGALDQIATLPLGTHDARLVGDTLVYSDTAADRVVVRGPAGAVWLDAPRPDPARLVGAVADPALARPAFTRGLLWLGDGRVVGGVSPGCVVGTDVDALRIARQVAWSDDPRVAVHGLALWPFDG